MSRRRGRPSRQYRLRVRTVRRDQIDYDALARAALERAAMSQQRDEEAPTPPQQDHLTRRHTSKRSKERRHDRLA